MVKQCVCDLGNTVAAEASRGLKAVPLAFPWRVVESRLATVPLLRSSQTP
jgi:hypothetical protein